MRIMIDGPDGAGKSTVCEKLANKFGCNIVRLTNGGDRSVHAYFELMSCDNVVHDRTFMSEIIYPKYFNRASRLDKRIVPYLFNMIDTLNIKTFILTADNDELIKRLQLRGDEFLDDYSKIKGINEDYLKIAFKHNFIVIDTTNKTIDETVEEIGGHLI